MSAAVATRSNIPSYGQRNNWVPRRPEVLNKICFSFTLQFKMISILGFW